MRKRARKSCQVDPANRRAARTLFGIGGVAGPQDRVSWAFALPLRSIRRPGGRSRHSARTDIDLREVSAT